MHEHCRWLADAVVHRIVRHVSGERIGCDHRTVAEASWQGVLRDVAFVPLSVVYRHLRFEDVITLHRAQQDTRSKTSQHAGHAVGRKVVILEERLDPLAACQLNAPIPVPDGTEVLAVLMELDSPVMLRVFLDDLYCPISGRVIENDRKLPRQVDTAKVDSGTVSGL